MKPNNPFDCKACKTEFKHKYEADNKISFYCKAG